MPDKNTLGDGPVDKEYREGMKLVAKTIDEMFNGELPKGEREVGFVLMVFPFGRSGRVNYMSNCDRAEVIATMKEQIARFEGRHVPGSGHG